MLVGYWKHISYMSVLYKCNFASLSYISAGEGFLVWKMFVVCSGIFPVVFVFSQGFLPFHIQSTKCFPFKNHLSYWAKCYAIIERHLNWRGIFVRQSIKANAHEPPITSSYFLSSTNKLIKFILFYAFRYQTCRS